MNIEYKKAILDEDTVKQLIDLSYIWEKEDITFGLRHNERGDLQEPCFVALLDNKIIGYTFGEYIVNDTHESFAKKGDKFFYISELYVVPEYRNKGIGKTLFKLIEEEVKGKVDFITLGTATKDYKKILNFYVDGSGMSVHSSYLFKKIK